MIRFALPIFLCALHAAGTAQPVANRPNVVVIFADDHTRQAISAYGSTIAQTPNIDRIARDGALFTNAYVANSICAPSRATFLTGKFSHKNGMTVNEKGPFDIRQPIFPRLLRQHGYQTAWIGKWHLQSLPDGFDYWKILPGQGFYNNPDFIGMPNDTTRIGGYVTDIISDLSLQWLDRRDPGKPFCLVIGEKATHREWTPDRQDYGAYDDLHFPLPDDFYDDYRNRPAARDQDMSVEKTMTLKGDLKVHVDFATSWMYKRLTPAQRDSFAAYYEERVSREFDSLHLSGKALTEWKFQRYLRDYLATARSLDRNVGRILDYLDRTGLARNTIVIYTSDQGFYLGEHGWFDKRFMYEQSMSTPLLMRYPGRVKPGTTISRLVQNIDLAPSIVDAAGIAVPADMQGRSLLPLLGNDRRQPWRNSLYYHYYEYPEPHHVAPHFGIRTDRFKLIRFYGPTVNWELYDLRKDPGEHNNVYGKPAYSRITSQLRRQLADLARFYGDQEALTLLKEKP